jgi:hypothetical protein
MSDVQPWTAASATNVTAPATIPHEPQSMIGFGKLGVHMVQCRNVTVYIEATNDPNRTVGWKQIFGNDAVSGGMKNSVTFTGVATDYVLWFDFPYAYFRVVASYSVSLNSLLVITRRA